jgi:PAS domain S-box-containing protein
MLFPLFTRRLFLLSNKAALTLASLLAFAFTVYSQSPANSPAQNIRTSQPSQTTEAMQTAPKPILALVQFQELTFWQLYQWQIVAVALFCSLQTLLIAVLLRECTRRGRTGLSLEESENKYRDVVETQTELICRFRPDTTLTFVNDAYCRYFNKSRDELIGLKFLELLPATERAATSRYFASLATNPRTETREHQVLRPDGSTGWQQWVNHVITNGGGRTVELQGIGRDVSKRKLAEEDLLRSEREFSTLVENSPDVIARLDRNLRYIYISPMFERISGVATYEFIGKTPQEIALPGYDWNSFETGCREAFVSGQTVVREFTFEERSYRTRIIPEFSPDSAIDSVMTISEDMTERLRAEQELLNLTARLFTLQDEERRRIARELHDGAAQNLFGITINLGNLEKHRSNPAETSRLIDECQSLAEQSLQEMRTFSICCIRRFWTRRDSRWRCNGTWKALPSEAESMST